MANGQQTAALTTLGAAWLTGGASLGASPASGAMAAAAGQAAAGGTAKGKGASSMSGLLSAGNAGPSSADAMFGSPFSVLDTSGWVVTFGNDAGVVAPVGDRGGNSASASQSPAYGESAPVAAPVAPLAARNDSGLLVVGLVVLLLVLAARGG